MKQEHFERIIDVIDEQSTWIRVHRRNTEGIVMVQVAGELKPRRCKLLTLVAVRPRNAYNKGQSWNIPEYKLDKALRTIRRKGEVSRSNILSPKNVADIIYYATNEFVNLDLI